MSAMYGFGAVCCRFASSDSVVGAPPSVRRSCHIQYQVQLFIYTTCNVSRAGRKVPAEKVTRGLQQELFLTLLRSKLRLLFEVRVSTSKPMSCFVLGAPFSSNTFIAS